MFLAQRGGSPSLGPSRFLLSAVDEYCDLGMGQHFGGFASEQQRRQSFSAVRGHENEVAVFCLRRFYESVPGMIIGQAKCFGLHLRILRQLDDFGRKALTAGACFFLPRLSGARMTPP